MKIALTILLLATSAAAQAKKPSLAYQQGVCDGLARQGAVAVILRTPSQRLSYYFRCSSDGTDTGVESPITEVIIEQRQ